MGPNEQRIKYALRLQFPITKNAAEYEALIWSLEIATEVNAYAVKVFSGSQLVIEQVNRRYESMVQSMMQYLSKAKKVM